MRQTKEKLVLLAFLLTVGGMLMLSQAHAAAKISDISYAKSGNNIKIRISHSEGMEGVPELFKKGKIIQLSFHKSVVWPKIEKRVKLRRNHDTTLMAYQYDKDTVRFRVLLPYNVNIINPTPTVVSDKTFTELTFTNISLTDNSKRVIPSVIKKINNGRSLKKKKYDYDETLLEQMLADKNDKKAVSKKSFQDEIKASMSSIFKNDSKEKSKGSFSVLTYIGKFVAFLGVILLGFYFIVNLMRKGVNGKGKLGFLNNFNSVSVLNRTYIGPKKNILLVKAHNQVFLIGSDEKGIHFLSEINDVSALLKDGEENITGTNFDTSINLANAEDKEFHLKEDISKPATQEKAPVKYSDKIKAKVKSLRPLQ